MSHKNKKPDPRIRTILFDLHHTLTRTRESPSSLFKRIAAECNIDLSKFTDEELQIGFTRVDGWFAEFQIRNDVDPKWGGQAEDWIEADRKILESLGIMNLSDEILLNLEKRWKHEVLNTDFEVFREDALDVIRGLHTRGYSLGICTRRHDNPSGLIHNSGVSQYFSTIQWSGVPGYTKPNPHLLIMAALELGVNPRLCAYVGNIVDLDVRAAIRADMLPILTVWANPKEADKSPDGTIIIENLCSLLNLLP